MNSLSSESEQDRPDTLMHWMAQTIASGSVHWPQALEHMAGWTGAHAMWITAATPPGQPLALLSAWGMPGVKLPDVPPPFPDGHPRVPMGLPGMAPLPAQAQDWIRTLGWASCAAWPYQAGSQHGWIGFVTARPTGRLDPSSARMSSAIELLQSLACREQSDIHGRRAAATMDQSSLAMVITNTQGIVEYANGAFLRTTGYTESEVLGQPIRLLNSGEHPGVVFREMWDTLLRGESWEGMLINRRKNGETYRADTALAPVRDSSGAIRWLVSVSRDVTREMDMEEEIRNSQKMDAMARLASGIAHDFNNTLTPILAYAEMAGLETAEAGPLRSYLHEILRSAERGTMLTRHLLAFGKRHEPELSLVELNEIVSEMERLIDEARMNDVKVVYDLDKNAGAIIGDASQIEQAVMNLVLNALEAMPSGGTLRLRTKGPAADASKVAGCSVIEVWDTGHGISDEAAAHIFEPFYTTKASGEGTGLGLTTVRFIMKTHDGQVEWESQPGKGTCFRLIFPAPHAAAAPTGAPATVAPLAQGTETILLVEDDMGVRSLAAELLRRTGYTVYDFGSAVQALHFARDTSQSFTALVCDLVLPDINGLSLYRQICEMRPGMRVLFMTGYGASGLKKMGMDAHAFKVLRKPFTIYDLSRHVRDVLDHPAPGA